MAKDILITPESGSLVFSGSTQPLSSSFVGDDSGSIVLHLEQTGNQNFTIEGSGSSLFNVEGTQGRLFSITDEMSGSIFSANTIEGLPVIEAFSDNQVKLGPFTNPVTIDSSGSVGIGTTTPNEALTVSGSISASGDLNISNITVTSTASNSYFANFIPSTGNGYAKFYQNSNSHLSLYMANSSGTTNVVLNSSGVSY